MKISYEDYVKQYTKGKFVCVCPMGVGGGNIVKELLKRGIKVNCFCDSNKAGNEYYGIKCIDFETLGILKKSGQEIVVILETSKWYNELKEKLILYGITNILRLHYFRFYTDNFVKRNKESLEEKIDKLCNILEDESSKKVVRHICRGWQMVSIPEKYFSEIESPIKEIYFDKDIIKPELKKKISFVDCGAYIGDTIIEANHNNGIDLKNVYAFELDKAICDKCEENIEEVRKKGVKIKLYPVGVSDSNKKVWIKHGNGDSKVVDSKNGKYAELVALDEILFEKDIDYIKMDIEGEELKALKGAAKLIKKQCPTLAICLYHKPEDMFLIPEYIKTLDPLYKIYIRHYSSTMFDTVCYAINERRINGCCKSIH